MSIRRWRNRPRLPRVSITCRCVRLREVLIEEDLSPALCRFLSLGADSSDHVQQTLGPDTPDQVILEHAADHDAVVVTAELISGR